MIVLLYSIGFVCIANAGLLAVVAVGVDANHQALKGLLRFAYGVSMVLTAECPDVVEDKN